MHVRAFSKHYNYALDSSQRSIAFTQDGISGPAEEQISDHNNPGMGVFATFEIYDATAMTHISLLPILWLSQPGV